MPFYPAVLPDVTLAGGDDAVFELPGGAQMVAVRVADLVSPAGRGLGGDGRSALVADLLAGRAHRLQWPSGTIR